MEKTQVGVHQSDSQGIASSNYLAIIGWAGRTGYVGSAALEN